MKRDSRSMPDQPRQFKITLTLDEAAVGQIREAARELLKELLSPTVSGPVRGSPADPPAAPTTKPSSLLISVREVAKLLGISERHVSRLANDGKAPAPVRLGQLVRWDVDQVRAWIRAGCPEVSGASGPKPVDE